MRLHYRILAMITACLLSACASDYRVAENKSAPPLSNQQGYLNFVVDSLDSLRSLEFMHMQSGESFYVGRAPVGISQVTLQLQAGEYCFIGFDAYHLRITFNGQGFCTYVEPGEVNYMGDFVVRNGVTIQQQHYGRFLALLRDDHPDICNAYVDPECAQ